MIHEFANGIDDKSVALSLIHIYDHHDAYDYVIHHEMGMVMIDGESMKINTGEISNHNNSAKHHLTVTNDTGMINVCLLYTSRCV